MATKNFLINKDSTVLVAGGPGLGGGIDGGNQADDHLPIGLWDDGAFNYYFFRAFLKFTLDFSDVVSITKAELYVRTSDGTHVSKSITSVLISRLTSAFNPTGGAEGTWSGNPDWSSQPSVTSSGQVTRSISKTTNTWNALDITAIVQAWMDGSANNGLRIKASAEAYPSNSNTPVSTEIRSRNSAASDPYILLTYVTNTPPSAPTLTAPANASVQITATPSFQFSHVDVDGDPLSSYDLQVSTDSTFAAVTHWNDSNDVTGISGLNVTRAYAGSALTRGVTYYWRVRTNDGTADGTWSATRSFRYNALPTAAMNAPASAALGVIHNLSDLALWTSGGTQAKCQFKFTPDDADNDNLTQYRLRLYNDNAGVKGTLLYDTGIVALAMPHDVQVTLNVTQGLVNGTQYWWSIDVFDGYEWAGESTATKFKVRWAQGLWEYDSTAGSTNWGFANGVTAQSVAFLFRSATSAGFDGATGKTAFATNIASVTRQRYLQVLVRLSTPTAGSSASLDDMTFSYYGVPSLPDGWSVA